MLPFVGDDIPSSDLIMLLRGAYKNFTYKDVAPLRHLSDDLYLLELFHGPTLAFKDIALQFLGVVFDYILARKNSVDDCCRHLRRYRFSRDRGLQGKDNIDIFVLHPHNRVSAVQRRQMTSVIAPNVFNIAVEGSFDDCQDLVKAMFNDQKFRDEMSLSAVNFISGARILAQVVYYVFAAARLASPKPLAFCEPTGNFGNVYAGYIAKSMGVPIDRLIVATNSNDILHRFFTTGEMRASTVLATVSPAWISRFPAILSACCFAINCMYNK